MAACLPRRRRRTTTTRCIWRIIVHAEKPSPEPLHPSRSSSNNLPLPPRLCYSIGGRGVASRSDVRSERCKRMACTFGRQQRSQEDDDAQWAYRRVCAQLKNRVRSHKSASTRALLCEWAPRIDGIGIGSGTGSDSNRNRGDKYLVGGATFLASSPRSLEDDTVVGGSDRRRPRVSPATLSRSALSRDGQGRWPSTGSREVDSSPICGSGQRDHHGGPPAAPAEAQERWEASATAAWRASSPWRSSICSTHRAHRTAVCTYVFLLLKAFRNNTRIVGTKLGKFSQLCVWDATKSAAYLGCYMRPKFGLPITDDVIITFHTGKNISAVSSWSAELSEVWSLMRN